MGKFSKYYPLFAGLSTSLIFGSTFIFSKKALAVISPFTLLSYRFLFALITLSIYIWIKKIKLDYSNAKTRWLQLLIMSFTGTFLYYTFEGYALTLVTPLQAGLFFALGPVFLVFLGLFWLKEKFYPQRLFYILLSVIGVGIVVYAQSNDTHSKVNYFGLFLMLITMIFMATGSILIKQAAPYFKDLERAYAMLVVGTISFFSVSMIQHLFFKKNDIFAFDKIFQGEVLISITFLGIIASVMGLLFLCYMTTHLDTSQFSIFTSLTTVVSVVLGVLFFHETMNLMIFMGSCMIITGVYMVNKS